MMMSSLLYAIFLRATTVGAAANLRWSSMFNHSMVLQQAPQRANVWGFSKPGANISVFLDGVEAGSATAQVQHENIEIIKRGVKRAATVLIWNAIVQLI